MIGSLLFFPEKDYNALPRDFGLVEEEVFVTTEDKVRLAAWFFPSGKAEAPALLFLHGNAGNMSGRLGKAKGWVERGVSVLLVDYRSYGKSEGKIQRGFDLVLDARAALRWLEEEKKIPASKIILYGESIGSYPAVALASEKKFAGLILEAPLTALSELARRHYGPVPEFLIRDFAMKNEEAIQGVRAPVFILHGTQDEICPFPMGERLYELAPAPKEFYAVQGGGHNDLPEIAGPAYIENPYLFMARENGFLV